MGEKIINKKSNDKYFYQNLLKKNPNNYEAILKLGLIDVKENNFSSAKHKFEKLIKIDINKYEGHLNLSNIYSLDGEALKAIDILNDYLNNVDENEEVVTAIAVNLLNVDKVISFSPQIFIDKKTKILKKDTRWMSNNPFYKNINQDSKYLNLNNINLLSKNIIYVGYNDLDRSDLDAVNYLNISKNLEIVKYILPKSITNTHYLSKYLVEKSLLNNILDEHMI